ncbi:thioredoxin domain-containing protein 5-like [Drosophila hydei]|uniref:Thioredoxin domain-containing protein 5-like n=1 Tax=Drosophila hydei TaxID=7224 RepID=A0A6J1MAT1_DROHY|nr:thioredoxin domain-containing protein 5-like [Drosophila hydei]
MLGNTDLCSPLILVLASLLVQAKLPLRQELISLSPNSLRSSSDGQVFLAELYVAHCESCSSLRLNYLAAILEDRSDANVTVGTIDCIKYANFCSELNITKYPTVGIFKRRGEQYRLLYGSPDLLTLMKVLGLQHDGGMVESRELRDERICNPGRVFALEPGTFTRTLSHGQFLVKFYSPTCFHCRVLAPAWIELATRLQSYDLCVGELDCTIAVAICNNFEIKHVPTIAWFRNGEKVQVYSGPRDLSYLKEFALDMLHGTYRNRYSYSTGSIKERNDVFLILAFTIYIFVL